MKNAWKWIIGIVVILVVVAGLVGLGVVVRNNMLANMSRQQAAFSARATAQSKVVPQGTPGPQTNAPGMPPNGFNRRGYPAFRGPGGAFMMPRGGQGFNRFGAGPRFSRGMPFGMGAFMLGGLARLVMFGLFVLLLVGAFLLGRRYSPQVPAAAAPAAVAAHACPKCGSSVADDAKYCPVCGKKQ